MMLSKKERLKFTKSELLSYIFVFSIVFSDILGNGNLNLLYFFGLFLFLNNFRLKKKLLKDVTIFFVPLLIMIIIEFIFSKNLFSIIKVGVFCIKIFVCIVLLSFTKRNFWEIDHLKLIRYINIYFTFLLLLSFISLKYPILWRLNDPYNSVSKTRLKFLYSEPSVLGLLCGVILIILSYYYFNTNKKYRKNLFLEIFLILIILTLTFSISGILYTCFAIFILYIWTSLKDLRRIPRRYYFYLILGIIFIVTILLTKNPISKRIFTIVSGKDASFNFRWSLGLEAFKKTMSTTNCWGMGLGNMNTTYGLTLLKSFNIDFKLANSFLYFLCENGMVGFIYLIYLFAFNLYKCTNSSKTIKPLKVALLFFVFVSQLVGGYFTDPLLWIIYGIICS